MPRHLLSIKHAAKPTDAKRFREIRSHFEKAAFAFDKVFFKIAPHYEEMMTAVVEALPFKKNAALEVVDLGCGTGNFARKLTHAFPRAHVTCVDLAANMLDMAKAKLGQNPRVAFWQGDVRDFDYGRSKFDVIVSSLVLHHIEKDEKTAFFRKLHRALRPGGIFFTVDIFVSPDPKMHAHYIEVWKAFIRKNGLPPAVAIRRHRREDRPVQLAEELAMVRKAGFRRVETMLKFYNFAAYFGMK